MALGSKGAIKSQSAKRLECSKIDLSDPSPTLLRPRYDPKSGHEVGAQKLPGKYDDCDGQDQHKDGHDRHQKATEFQAPAF